MLKNILVVVFGGLILWFVQDYLKDMPTATYIISDAIEIPSSKESHEYAQEVLIVNSGRSVVKTVSIKVPHHVSTYKLTKHSNQIEEKIFSDVNSFELVYPELPSGQKLRVLIRYDGSPIIKSWISISHADGNAQAQEDQSSKINYAWLWLAFTAGMLFSTFGDLRKWKRESFGKWSDGDNLFRNDKPWYASSAEWSEMQFEAIDRSLNRYSYSNIKESSYYQLLNRPKPTLLSAEKWTSLQKNASDLLMARLSKEVTSYSNTEKLIDFFKLEKPEALSTEQWSNFEKSLTEMLKNKLLPAHMNAQQYVNMLDDKNLILNKLPNLVANEIFELAQKYYANYLTSRDTLEFLNDPSATLKTVRFDLLTEDQSKSVKNTILRFARMKEMPSRWELHELELFVSKEKPEWMLEAEFNSICEFVNQTKSLSDKHEALYRQQRELESNKLETEKLKEHVLAQLDLIDKVITNPNAIDNIESYDQTFALGNRKNLEFVASLLKAAPKSV